MRGQSRNKGLIIAKDRTAANATTRTKVGKKAQFSRDSSVECIGCQRQEFCRRFGKRKQKQAVLSIIHETVVWNKEIRMNHNPEWGRGAKEFQQFQCTRTHKHVYTERVKQAHDRMRRESVLPNDVILPISDGSRPESCFVGRGPIDRTSRMPVRGQQRYRTKDWTVSNPTMNKKKGKKAKKIGWVCHFVGFGSH